MKIINFGKIIIPRRIHPHPGKDDPGSPVPAMEGRGGVFFAGHLILGLAIAPALIIVGALLASYAVRHYPEELRTG